MKHTRLTRLLALVLLCAVLLTGCDKIGDIAGNLGEIAGGVGDAIDGLGGIIDDVAGAVGSGTLVDAFGTDYGETGETLTFPSERAYYRTLLTDAGKKLYNQVYSNAFRRIEKFDLVEKTTPEELADVITAVICDHPDIFWLSNEYSYNHTADGSVVGAVLMYYEFEEGFDAAVDSFKANAQEIVDAALEYDSLIEQELFVHDYIAQNTVYDESTPYSQSAYSAMVEGKSVCAGYARAFQYIMNQLNIPCFYVLGQADGGMHAWNIVQLNQAYYCVDLLWDDSTHQEEDECYHTYFNVPDSAFGDRHERQGLSLQLPECTMNDLSYYAVFGTEGEDPSAMTVEILGYGKDDVAQDLEEVYAAFTDAVTNNGLGVTVVTLPIAGQELLDEVFADVQAQGYMDGFAAQAAENLGVSGYSVGISLSAALLGDGAVLLTATITMNEA